MIKKKRFNLSNSLQKGFEETISIVENDEKLYRNVTIPINRIVTDPDNPRKLYLNIDDIHHGLDKKDPFYKEKNDEYESILELSNSIKESGLIQPIVVYKQLEKYCIIAGERRYLACVLAEKAEIEARIFQKHPTTLDIKLIQWFENNERKDLSLYERIENLKSIYDALTLDKKIAKVNGTLFQNVTKLAKTQAAQYANIITGHANVLEAIKLNIITSLDKATVINSCEDAALRQKAIDLCKSGASLIQLRSFFSTERRVSLMNKQETRGKKAKKINLGHSYYPEVVRTLIEAVVTLPQFATAKDKFISIDWHDLKSVSQAFDNLKNLIELSLKEKHE